MESVSDVIEALGGPAVLAKEVVGPLEKDASTVRQWKKRNSIPEEYWISIAEFAKRKKVSGVHLKALMNIKLSAFK